MKNNTLSNTFFVFRNIYRYDRRLMAYSFIEVAAGILLPFCEILLPSLAVRALMGTTLTRTDQLEIAICITAIVLLYFIKGFAKKQCVWRYSYLMQGSAHDLLAHFYHAEYAKMHKELGRYRSLRGRMDSNTENSYKSVLLACKNIVTGAVGSIFYFLFLMDSQWYLILLVLMIGVIQYIFLQLAGKYELKNRPALDQSKREYEYLIQAACDSAHGKEIRLFGMYSWLSQRINCAFHRVWSISRRIKSIYAAAQTGGLFAELIRDAAVYLSMIFLTVKGYLTIDSMLFYVGLMRGLSVFARKTLEGVRLLKKEDSVLCDIRSFLGDGNVFSAALQPVEGKTDFTKEPSFIKSSPPVIEFQDISFGYESKELLYENFDLKIESGEKLAIVGVNGAGKSTLVNLLCGFLIPVRGEVLIDGQPLSKIGRQIRRKLFSAVFQEYFLLPATLAENVAPTNPEDKAGILSCLKQVGLMPVLEKKKAGLDSKMANIGGQGLVLSGGEQQKLLLARAIYKDAPILILDEPTSALDPIAEKQVYESYRQFAEDKTSIFISHRLASTRFCDKICLLDHGRIAEYGTHDTLMEKKGLYYTMFEAQSKSYREEASNEEA